MMKFRLGSLDLYRPNIEITAQLWKNCWHNAACDLDGAVFQGLVSLRFAISLSTFTISCARFGLPDASCSLSSDFQEQPSLMTHATYTFLFCYLKYDL